jgi:hypothetical protein
MAAAREIYGTAGLYSEGRQTSGYGEISWRIASRCSGNASAKQLNCGYNELLS